MGLLHTIGQTIARAMNCEGCAMRREAMKRMLEAGAAHAARLAALRRGENPDAIKPKAVQASDASGTKARATAGRPAGKASAQHEQQGMEGAEGAGAHKGRIPVPGVSKARGRKASTR